MGGLFGKEGGDWELLPCHVATASGGMKMQACTCHIVHLLPSFTSVLSM